MKKTNKKLCNICNYFDALEDQNICRKCYDFNLQTLNLAVKNMFKNIPLIKFNN